LDEEFLHVDFLKHAYTLITKGDRPSDVHVATLVDRLLDLARLSARIACELTWDNIRAECKGIETAGRDINVCVYRLSDQFNRTRSSGGLGVTARKPPVPGHPARPLATTVSQLVANGSVPLDAASAWSSPETIQALRTTLFERLKEPIYAALEEKLYNELSESLPRQFEARLRLDLEPRILDGLRTTLLETLTPRVVD
ncbi:hypothetical protein C8Q73DRAFT_627843, partial [Cubamyces lactineus]